MVIWFLWGLVFFSPWIMDKILLAKHCPGSACSWLVWWVTQLSKLSTSVFTELGVSLSLWGWQEAIASSTTVETLRGKIRVFLFRTTEFPKRKGFRHGLPSRWLQTLQLSTSALWWQGGSPPLCGSLVTLDLWNQPLAEQGKASGGIYSLSFLILCLFFERIIW